MAIPIYLLTVVISFFTNVGIEIIKPITIKKRGYIKIKDYDKDYLAEQLQILQHDLGITSGKLVFNIMRVFSFLLYLLFSLAEAMIPIGNLLMSTMRVYFYDAIINDELNNNDYIDNSKEEERLFGKAALKKYNQFTKLNNKINNSDKKEIIESLIIEGASREKIVKMFHDMKKELKEETIIEKNENINQNANNILDYICMNKNLSNNQKLQILKKMKRVYYIGKNTNFPIEYALNCNEKQTKQKVKQKKEN